MMLLVLEGPTVQLFIFFKKGFCLLKGWRCLKLFSAVRRMFLSFFFAGCQSALTHRLWVISSDMSD